MKLISEAMRQGAVGKAQHYDDYFDGYPINACCAIGAVAIGLGLADKPTRGVTTMELVESQIDHIHGRSESLVYPLKAVLTLFNHSNPDDGLDLHDSSLSEMIVMANDSAKLPIAEIADLVEAGEKAWMKEQECITS